ncbi:MAG TPA: VacJ family lipoprotein, partial [Burkholderiales bacterium]|nr:VacJ family lipoprotein [Burkholderiales bacterium]
RLLEEAALDKYAFERDAYLQRRRSLIDRGQTPRERPPSQAPEGQPHADASPGAAPAVPPRSAAVYEPRVPEHYQAVLATEHGG